MPVFPAADRSSGRADGERRPCPYCQGNAINLGRYFRAPAVDDLKEWRKVAFLVKHGFVFQSLHDPETSRRIGYPQTLEEARIFVKKYRHLAVKPLAEVVSITARRPGLKK